MPEGQNEDKKDRRIRRRSFASLSRTLARAGAQPVRTVHMGITKSFLMLMVNMSGRRKPVVKRVRQVHQVAKTVKVLLAPLIGIPQQV